MSKKIFIVICVAVLVVLGTFLLIQQTSQNTPSSTVSPTPFSSGTNPVSFQEIPFPSISPVAVIEDPGVVWLPKPIRLPDDPSLFALFTDSSRLYKAGTQNGQDLLFIFMQGLGEYYRLLRKEGDRYAIIANGQNLYAEPLRMGCT